VILHIPELRVIVLACARACARLFVCVFANCKGGNMSTDLGEIGLEVFL